MTFIELTTAVLVDPAEVAAVTQNKAGGSRIYMRGSGTKSYLEVDLSVAEVSSRLLTRPPARSGPSLRSELSPRPGPRSAP